MEKAYERVIKRFLAAHIADGSRVLDVGCGTGWTALFVARTKADCVVDGVDVDELRIHRANRLFVRAKRDCVVRCVRCGAEELARRLGRARYDVVVSCHSLHHYRDPVRALKQMRRVLAPGGAVLLAELAPAYGETIDDCARYSLRKVRAFFRRAGLSVLAGEQRRPGVVLVRAASVRPRRVSRS